jgi:hypothetical protein
MGDDDVLLARESFIDEMVNGHEPNATIDFQKAT